VNLILNVFNETFSGHLFNDMQETSLVEEEIRHHDRLKNLLEWFSEGYVGGISFVC